MAKYISVTSNKVSSKFHLSYKFFASQSNFRIALGPLAVEPVRSSNYYGHYVVVIGPSHRQRAKSPLGTVLIINLLGKGFTPRACMGDGGSI